MTPAVGCRMILKSRCFVDGVLQNCRVRKFSFLVSKRKDIYQISPLTRGCSPISKKTDDEIVIQRRFYCDKPPEAAESRNINPAGNLQAKILYFDTYALVQKMISRGFTEEQAVGIVEAFQEVLQTSIDHQTKVLVTKSQQEISIQQMMAHINAVKKDMVILEKSEFTMLRNETQKQTMEIEQMKKDLKAEMDKVRGNVTLDINLERSRASEAHAGNERKLQALHNKLETDVAKLQTVFESYKSELYRNLMAIAVGLGGVTLGVMRLMS